jgi:hypothetical protein
MASNDDVSFVAPAQGEPELPESGDNRLWYRDRGTDAVLVFVHGIFSDNRSCWLNEGPPPVYWPDLVSRDRRFNPYSIYLGGYYTAMDAGPFKVQHCADQLYRALGRPDRPGAQSVLQRGTLIFVCHSTGGIIVRYLLDLHAAEFKNKTVGLVLIASPSYGSGWASKLSWLSEFYNAQLARQLEWGNNSLDDLDERFHLLIKEHRIPHLLGVEAYENHFVFHRKFLPDRRLVVDKDSAGRYFAPPHQLAGTDHFTSVKPDSERHPAHELLVDFCADCERYQRSHSDPDSGPSSGSRATSAKENTAVPSTVASLIRDFRDYIDDKTSGFVGRRFLFDALDRFCNSHPRGYFIIRGEPGIGKTSFAAQLVRKQGLIHHFNIRAEGVTTSQAFVENVSAQLVTRFRLAVERIPPDAGRDATFLHLLLKQASQKLAHGENLIIVVDALDEADSPAMGENPLYLPLLLPESCYIVVTTRPTSDPKSPSFKALCEQEFFRLDDELAENQADVAKFIEQFLTRPGIVGYCEAHNLSSRDFVERLTQASEGNFMYLRYILPEIESGRYHALDTAELPIGLYKYYEDHWERMKGVGGDAWFDYKLPVVAALTVVREPVSIELLDKFSGISNRARVREVIQEWSAFIEERRVARVDESQIRYRIYHASFHDFLASKPEVAELNQVENRIIDSTRMKYGRKGRDRAAKK